MNSSVQSVYNNCAFVDFIWTERPKLQKSLFSDQWKDLSIAQQINDLLIRAADSISEFNPDFDPQIRAADGRSEIFKPISVPIRQKNI